LWISKRQQEEEDEKDEKGRKRSSPADVFLLSSLVHDLYYLLRLLQMEY
jgi:hypothetical protein